MYMRRVCKPQDPAFLYDLLATAGLTPDDGDNVGTDTGKEGRVSAHASHQVPGSRPASQDEGRMRPPMLRSKSSPNWTRTNNPYVTSSGGNSSS